jgi:hypothetical protein
MARWLVWVLLAASGCSSTSSLLTARFAREHSCQRDAVFVREAGQNVYVAEGCGQRAEYVCQSFAGVSGSEKGCAERGVNPQTSPEAPKKVYSTVQEPPR